MARFEDTPEHRRGTWDPERQRMVYPGRPATKRQLRYARDLCRELGVPWVKPGSRGAAQALIQSLKARQERLDRP